MPHEWDASRIRDRLLRDAEPRGRGIPRAAVRSDAPVPEEPPAPTFDDTRLVDEIRALRASVDEIRDLLRTAFANEQSAQRAQLVAGPRPVSTRWPTESGRRARSAGSAGVGRSGARPTFPPSPLLTTEQLAGRWRLSPSSVLARWRKGVIPSPTNPEQTRNFRWSRVVIEQFERGEWSPETAFDGAERSADLSRDLTIT
jgi:hypothetical protein